MFVHSKKSTFVTRAEEEMLHMLIERVKKNKNDCNCDSCNITTVNAPVKRGKRKQPCNNLFINSVYVNAYRSAPTRMDVKGSSEREYKKKRRMTSTKKEGEKITAHFRPMTIELDNSTRPNEPEISASCYSTLMHRSR